VSDSEEATRCGYRTAGSERLCPAAPDSRVTVGCVHEHINEGWLCAEHLRNLNEGGSSCLTCYRLPDDSHRCPVIGRVMV
jgi:hypothetical protein